MNLPNTLELTWRNLGGCVRVVGTLKGNDTKETRRVWEAPTLEIAIQKAIEEAMVELDRLKNPALPEVSLS
jgi:hypothetical protein